jgi:hypothetical protein
MEEINKWIILGGLPVIAGLLCKIFLGGVWIIYGSILFACLELILWSAWNNS